MLLSPEEKLWKRITKHFGNNEEVWKELWNSEIIMDFLISKEKLKLNDKENKQLKSKIDEILAHSKKRNEWFMLNKQSFFKLRSIGFYFMQIPPCIQSAIYSM